MKTSEKIISYINQHGQVTAGQLVDHLNISDRGVRKQLKNLLDDGQITKVGKLPRVYYAPLVSPAHIYPKDTSNIQIDSKTHQLLDKEFYYISPRGEIHQGYKGFEAWCQERNLPVTKTAGQYVKVFKKFDAYKREGLIDGTHKMKDTFDDLALDKVFYVDFYSIEIFGKTKLGQLLLFAKQSQNRGLINEVVEIIEPALSRVMKKYRIDGVGFIPPTVKRELQFMKQLQNKLRLDTRILDIHKIRTPVAVPQKTLTKLSDRVINARETMSLDDRGTYNNILLIDDALGSGATLNEVAKKIRQKGLCRGKIIGFVVTGSFKGFEIISEV